ncbi:hypothetical protein H2248_012527 [Termitomyces sp. 'cryptogamus']|nr:hypothetical protein H2248_012527 [Termitomyces sp. 'cryptogamus']
MSGMAAIPSAEEVWNQDIILGFFESGSRFSNRSPAPAYQKHVDEAYIARLGKSNPTKPNNKGEPSMILLMVSAKGVEDVSPNLFPYPVLIAQGGRGGGFRA